MAKKKTKTVLLISITLITLILGAVAVVTALKLRQLATVPVAPNAPESKPQAAEGTQATNVACEYTFTVEAVEVEVGEVACLSKTAYIGDQILNSGDSVQTGDVITYKIAIDTSALTEGQAAAITVTDVLPEGLTIDEYESCQFSESTRTLTCEVDETVEEVAYQATVDTTASGTLENTATISEANSTDSTCSTSLVVEEVEPGTVACLSKSAYKGATAMKSSDTVSPGDTIVYRVIVDSSALNEGQSTDVTISDPLPSGVTFVQSQDCVYDQDTRNVTCTLADVTSSGNPYADYQVKINDTATGAITNTATVSEANSADDTCSQTINVEESTTEPTPTPTPTPTATPWPGCNQTCEVDADCSGSLICDDVSGTCRNAACTTSSTCVCQTAQPELPEAGSILPTLYLLMGGLAVIGLGALGLLLF